jgi:hypothetical protein
VLLPAAMGVLAEAVMFFLPERTISLPLTGKLLAWVFLAFVAAFALTNSLRMASIVSADQAAARADRQTEGVRTADQALEAARGKRDEACGRGLGKTVACQSRQAEVSKLETKQTQATIKVAAQAKPESTDFAKLVAWLSNGHLAPRRRGLRHALAVLPDAPAPGRRPGPDAGTSVTRIPICIVLVAVRRGEITKVARSN